MSIKNWKTYLLNWNSRILENEKYLKTFHILDAFPDIQSNKGMGKGASKEDIKALEKRLEITLPNSYKKFLMASNGWSHITMGINFLSDVNVEWFYNTDKLWVDEWIDSESEDEISDAEYFSYGSKQDPINIRNEYMKYLLKISEDQDGYVYLLNPKIKTKDGEWEAWAFGTKLPGAFRFQSFEKMMQAEKKQALTDVEESSNILSIWKLKITKILFFLIFSPLIIVNSIFVYIFRLLSWVGSLFKSGPKA